MGSDHDAGRRCVVTLPETCSMHRSKHVDNIQLWLISLVELVRGIYLRGGEFPNPTFEGRSCTTYAVSERYGTCNRTCKLLELVENTGNLVRLASPVRFASLPTRGSERFDVSSRWNVTGIPRDRHSGKCLRRNRPGDRYAKRR